MNLEKYFRETNGTGILATANKDGDVDTAIYAKPHLLNDGTLGFIMRDRLTHANLMSNPRANYMFIQHTHGFKGIRLFLKMSREYTDEKLIASMSRRHLSPEEDRAKGPKFLVAFTVEKALHLIGGDEFRVSAH